MLEVGVLAVVALLPDIHDVVRTGDVALGVVADVADGTEPILVAAGSVVDNVDGLAGKVALKGSGPAVEVRGVAAVGNDVDGVDLGTVLELVEDVLDMKVAFRPWSASWRMIRPASVCRPP